MRVHVTAVDMLDALADRSACRRAHVGCVIVRASDSAIVGAGYNVGAPMILGGNPRLSMPRLCTGEEGACGCIHAERVALSSLGTGSLGEGHGARVEVYTSLSPCAQCALDVLSALDVLVWFYRDEYRLRGGLALLADRGVRAERIPS